MSRCRLALPWLLVPALAGAAPETWHFDTMHTQIAFAVDHLGFARALGLVKVKDGEVRFDAADWSTAAVTVDIDLATLGMGDAPWEDTVRSWRFLNTRRWPLATFRGHRVERTGPADGVIHGELELHGTRQPVDLTFHMNRLGNDPYTLRRTAGFSARTTLKRSAFGMDRLLSAVGDEVELRIEVELQRGAGRRSAAPSAGRDDPRGETDDEPAQ